MKHHRNRIVLFALFTIITLVMCAYFTFDYLALSLAVIDFESYYAKDVADKVVAILEREQRSDVYLGIYFIAQWVAGLVLFLLAKRKN